MTEASERLLIVAPIGRDAELMCGQLQSRGMDCRACTTVDEMCESMDDGVGALLLTEEALTAAAMHGLAERLRKQPPWSDIPLIILTGAPSFEAKGRSLGELGVRSNVTLVDRPVRIASLVSAVQAALRARRRQYEVRDLMEKLEDRVRERDRFLAILGHELRNPLGAILLAAQMVDEDGKLDGDHAQLIERQSRHLTRLVNDLLDLSRVVSGKIVLKPQVVDLRAIMGQVLETMSDPARAQKITIELHLPEEMMPARVDPVRADQIISNVISNAIKYTPEGGHVRLVMKQEEGSNIISVQDDGVGIAADRLKTIFELFAQAENAIGRAQGGMGIGLALVRNLVELHGGSIEVTSDGEGHGSEFTIRFPVAESSAEAAPRVSTTGAAARHDLPRRIVIVEDNDDVRELLRLKLKRLGHAVEAVGDGQVGVQVIVEGKPDMALVDIGLPGLDGYGVAAEVREKLGEAVILVAVSGFGQPDDKRKALEAGFDEHITKPADVHDIESVLHRFPPRNSLL
jgi:signal transduction histidine kinase/ActR/RegA family two-component response regulator